MHTGTRLMGGHHESLDGVVPVEVAEEHLWKPLPQEGSVPQPDQAKPLETGSYDLAALNIGATAFDTNPVLLGAVDSGLLGEPPVKLAVDGDFSGVHTRLDRIAELAAVAAEMIKNLDGEQTTGGSARDLGDALAKIYPPGHGPVPADLASGVTADVLESHVAALVDPHGTGHYLPLAPAADGSERGLRLRLVLFNAQQRTPWTDSGEASMEQYLEGFARPTDKAHTGWTVSGDLGAKGSVYDQTAAEQKAHSGSDTQTGASFVQAGVSVGGGWESLKMDKHLSGGMRINVATYGGPLAAHQMDAVWMISYERQGATVPRSTRAVVIPKSVSTMAPETRAGDLGFPGVAKAAEEDVPTRVVMDQDLAASMSYPEKLVAPEVLQQVRQLVAAEGIDVDDPKIASYLDSLFSSEALKSGLTLGVTRALLVKPKEAWGGGLGTFGFRHVGVRVTVVRGTGVGKRKRPKVNLHRGGQGFRQDTKADESTFKKKIELTGAFRARLPEGLVAGKGDLGRHWSQTKENAEVVTNRHIVRAMVQDSDTYEMAEDVTYEIEVFRKFSMRQHLEVLSSVTASGMRYVDTAFAGRLGRLWKSVFGDRATAVSTASVTVTGVRMLVPMFVTEPADTYRLADPRPRSPKTEFSAGRPPFLDGKKEKERVALSKAIAEVGQGYHAWVDPRFVSLLPTVTKFGGDSPPFSFGVKADGGPTVQSLAAESGLDEANLLSNLGSLLTTGEKLPGGVTLRMLLGAGERIGTTALNAPNFTETSIETESKTKSDSGNVTSLELHVGSKKEDRQPELIIGAPSASWGGAKGKDSTASGGTYLEENRERRELFHYYKFSYELYAMRDGAGYHLRGSASRSLIVAIPASKAEELVAIYGSLMNPDIGSHRPSVTLDGLGEARHRVGLASALLRQLAGAEQDLETVKDEEREALLAQIDDIISRIDRVGLFAPDVAKLRQAYEELLAAVADSDDPVLVARRAQITALMSDLDTLVNDLAALAGHVTEAVPSPTTSTSTPPAAPAST